MASTRPDRRERPRWVVGEVLEPRFLVVGGRRVAVRRYGGTGCPVKDVTRVGRDGPVAPRARRRGGP